MSALEPFVFEPVYKTYFWGGSRLKTLCSKSIVPDPCAEGWLIADRPEGMSRVKQGAFQGCSLSDLVGRLGERLLGKGRSNRTFPLLIKLIDAKEHLSIQVHPCEKSALKRGGEAKTELWYMLSGGSVLSGFKKSSDVEKVRHAISTDRLKDLLHQFDLQAGEALFVPGGCPHSILGGSLLLEIQQNSNTTYRMFDWNRLEPDGNPRSLHIEQALECVSFKTSELRPKRIQSENSLIHASSHFQVERIHYSQGYCVHANPNSFQIVFCLKEMTAYLLAADGSPLWFDGSGSLLRIFL